VGVRASLCSITSHVLFLILLSLVHNWDFLAIDKKETTRAGFLGQTANGHFADARYTR
jgi:hypothetical protein